jgi:hypothetical protein
MKKLALALLFFSAPAVAQTMPMDTAQQRAQADAQVNQTLLQTQQNNAQLNFQLQQQQIQQQQLFNAIPPLSYQQPANAPPRPLIPGQP